MFKDKKLQNIITSIAMIILGFALIAAPERLFALFLRIICAVVILIEVVRIVNLVRFYKKSPEFTVVLINEILIAAVALIVLINPTATIRILTKVLGVYLMITSCIRIYAYSKLPKVSAVWVSIIFDAITAVAGFWLLIQPASLSELLGIFLGIAVIVKAVGLLISAVSENPSSKKDGYIEAEFKDKSDEK